MIGKKAGWLFIKTALWGGVSIAAMALIAAVGAALGEQWEWEKHQQ